MTTEQIVDRVCRAADAGDAVGAGAHVRSLNAHLDATGGSLAEADTRRMLAAMEQLASRLTGDDPIALSKQIETLGKGKPVDSKALTDVWKKLYGLLSKHDVAVSTDTIRIALGGLRSARAFDLLAKTCDRALLREFGGPADPHFRRLYGQALIDSGNLVAGIEILDATLKAGPLPAVELAQVQGLLGRAYKQVYVNQMASGGGESTKRQYGMAIVKSAESYALGYDPQRAAETCWHGVNLVAVLKRAQADGVEVNVGHRADDVAKSLLTALTPKVEAGTASAWDLATLAEAHYALGQYQQAQQRYGEYATKDNDSFAVAGTVRQLQEVWRAHASGNAEAIASMEILNNVLMERPRSTVTVSRQESQALESHVKGGGKVVVRALIDLVRSASGVASVRAKKATELYASGQRVGTAFLFRGRDLSKSLGDDLYIMTNAHVLADDAYPRDQIEHPLRLEEAEIVFEQPLVGTVQTAKFDMKIVACLPSSDHDCTILRLTDKPGSIEPLPLQMSTKPRARKATERRSEVTKVCVIGHPKGEDLQVSFKDEFFIGDNGEVVDYGPRRPDSDGAVYLHYDTPTEGGNSGSPVFDRSTWTVIGLHHAGAGAERLNGANGVQLDANEGICLQSIAAKIAKPTKASKDKWFRRRT